MKPGEFVVSEYTRQLGRVTEADDPDGPFQVEWADGSVTSEILREKGKHWHPCMPREVAEQVLVLVQGYLDRQYGEGHVPKLYEPGHEGNYWNISLEGAEGWAYEVTCERSIAWPVGVHLEADTMWCLALYWSD